MTGTILILHNVTSVLAIVLCWWTAHQFAVSTPPGKFIAATLGVIGMSILVTMFGRNFSGASEAMIVVSKGGLALFLVGLAIRNHRLGKDDPDHPGLYDSPSWRHRAANAEAKVQALARAVQSPDPQLAKTMAETLKAPRPKR
ncbi:hypothetical protein [Pseudoroseicyclus aestuarii]|uniref:Uncharacterized protein n=1 Tax=Pseudoroseicyclus aestuarii TaxID=1795041 RepID=A0A318SLX9_9RHOB|nr:hypothetical protein [Pseudoroseicyclus aestuarii]PYE80803.1 hypothetical protein DFP88_11113 [Pseudoroseicyclus aestuarii]